MTRVTGSSVLSAVHRSASLFFLAVLVAACGGGGDSGPPPVSLTAVSVTGMPSEPLAPMQTAQLTARASYSDGSIKDVTTTSTWSTSNANVLTVTTTGLATATGPGQAEVIASIGGVSGRAGMQVVALPAAYFADGIEFAFDYELDVQGRVASYRVSLRPGIAYPPLPIGGAWDLPECQGNLHGDYECIHAITMTEGTWTAWPMLGTGGRLNSFVADAGHTNYLYSYGQFGLARIDSAYRSSMGHFSSSGTSTVSYDAAGRLSGVSELGKSCDLTICSIRQSATVVAIDGQGRMQRAEGTYSDDSSGPSTPRVTTWTYGAAGLMERMDSIETGSLVKTTSTRYTADADGWLTSRVKRFELSDGSPVTETVDTYAIMRSGRLVTEEQFTQAEPAGFYSRRTPQRVRYEWGRLPTEPTFVPRALTGLNGADYFGIISSHHR
jgi:hypothetical protein